MRMIVLPWANHTIALECPDDPLRLGRVVVFRRLEDADAAGAAEVLVIMTGSCRRGRGGGGGRCRSGGWRREHRVQYPEAGPRPARWRPDTTPRRAWPAFDRVHDALWRAVHRPRRAF